MPDTDTVSPYGDDVRDPYDADDTKNPHEPGGDDDQADDDGGEEETTDEKPAARKSTRKTAKRG